MSKIRAHPPSWPRRRHTCRGDLSPRMCRQKGIFLQSELHLQKVSINCCGLSSFFLTIYNHGLPPTMRESLKRILASFKSFKTPWNKENSLYINSIQVNLFTWSSFYCFRICSKLKIREKFTFHLNSEIMIRLHHHFFTTPNSSAVEKVQRLKQGLLLEYLWPDYTSVTSHLFQEGFDRKN